MTDLESLLLYLGVKIGIGHVCLWCDGRGREAYGSTQAVQQHMQAKGHCKLRWDINDETDEFPFEEFYDFDQQDQSMGMDTDSKDEDLTQETTNTQLTQTTTKRHVVELADDGELVLNDGSRIGHRDYHTYYRQRYRDSHTRTPVAVLRGIKQRYMALSTTSSIRMGRPVTNKHVQSNQRHVQKLQQKQRQRYERRSHQVLGKYFRDQTGLK